MTFFNIKNFLLFAALEEIVLKLAEVVQNYDYRSHFNTWQSGHITVLLCSCPYMVMLPAQLT